MYVQYTLLRYTFSYLPYKVYVGNLIYSSHFTIQKSVPQSVHTRILIFILHLSRLASATRNIMATSRRLSGLQKDVLSLYRSVLRAAVRKDRGGSAASSSSSSSTEAAAAADSSHSRCNIIPAYRLLCSTPNSSVSYARDQFRREASSVRRSDFKTIEYKIRKGKKQLELLKMPGVNFVGGAR